MTTLKYLLLGEWFLVVLLISGCRKEHVPAPAQSMVVVPSDAVPVIKAKAQTIFAHYMPGYEDPSTSGNGKWGIHWTMATMDPTIIVDGKRQIASYFYPMIGPYASSDRDVIDYHLLLMKYAGIDGVIVDWSGIHNDYDSPLIRRNTDSIFARIPGVGLKFAICYEDASLRNVLTFQGIGYVTAARQDFEYLRTAYFKYSHYAAVNDKPLLLCFGPQAILTPEDWRQAFSEFAVKPEFISLEYHGDVTGSLGGGEFAWVAARGVPELHDFYVNRSSQSMIIAGAYPGFKDFYAPGGWGSTLFVIDHNGTTELQACLEEAKTVNAPILQLITWNDFNEGTMLEPTLEFEYSLLEKVQQYAGVSYTKSELQLIFQWYTKRKKYKSDVAMEQKLDQVYTALVSLQVSKAADILAAIP